MSDQSDPFGLERHRVYWQALGNFMDMFAVVEATLQVVLWHYAKTPVPIARAIFSGARIETCMNFINRICDVVDPGPEKRADLKYVFDQLGLINGVRNTLIHHGAYFVPGQAEAMVTSNAFIALDEARLKSTPMSAVILADMTKDLHKIQAHLYARHYEHSADPAPDVLTYMQEQILLAPWRYKPHPQSQNQKGNRERAPKRQRPQTPSQP